MKLEQVLNFGIAPNDANISYANAKAIAAFLSHIDELKVGTLAVEVSQGSPQEWRKYTIAEIEGVIPDTAVLEFYVWLGGIPDSDLAKWHNVRAIEKELVQNPRIEVGLNRFLSQFSAGLYMMGTSFATNAVTAAVVKAWTDVHGLPPETPADPIPGDPPVIIPTGVVGNWSIVHGRAVLGPGSDAFPIGAEVTEPRGTFVRMSDWWQLKES